jgi:hypothetical protein
MAIVGVHPVERSNLRLTGWRYYLAMDMKMKIYGLLDKYWGDKEYSKQLSADVINMCKEELTKFGYDMSRIVVLCDETNNTPERLSRGEFWVDIIINFGYPDYPVAVLSFEKNKGPFYVLR